MTINQILFVERRKFYGYYAKEFRENEEDFGT